jgi:hypothetical protein
MVRHIVLWTLKETSDGTTAERIALEMKSRIEALADCVPGIVAIEVGLDFSRTKASADVALCSSFEDLAALEAYQVHPRHREVAEFVGSVTSSRVVVDYEA